MRARTLLLIIFSILLIGISAGFADNTAGGGGQPWGGDVPNDDEDDSTTTVLTPQENLTQTPKIIYNLQGQRVETPQKGKIYIIGGKKVLWR